MDFKDYVNTLAGRFSFVTSLFNKSELLISYDDLRKKKKVHEEILYFKEDGGENTGLFLFGYEFFLHEMSEQEFKRNLGQNTLNFKIYKAYSDLKKKQRKVKITDILNQIQDKRKDSIELHKILRRILTLAYYLNWELVKDPKDLEGDSFVDIPKNYLTKITQRYNFDFTAAIYEDEDCFLFLNARGKMNLVFKNLNDFTKKDVENIVFRTLKRVFKIKKVTVVQ